MTSHPLLRALTSSKPAFGSWITLQNTFIARTLALSSPHLSWVCIDCEHGLIPLQGGAAEIIAAIQGFGGDDILSTLVRIPATGACANDGATWQIKIALDAGAKGIVVPMVSNAAQARSIVSAARFPPVGTRGFGNPVTQQSWGLSPTEYLKQANDSVLVLGQIETREGVENIEDILKVDGLDGVFIGPYDLSLAHNETTPNPDPVPVMEELIQKILQSAHNSGKKCAIYCTSGEQAARRAQEGFDMINVIGDLGAMIESLKRNFAIAAGDKSI
ncbi:Pyruvate kinase-like domain superfamily protein [Abortiporus biennis]